MAETEPNNMQAPDVVSKADFDKVKNQMLAWQAKATDLEKRFDGIDPEKVKADAAALKQLLKERAQEGDKNDVETLLERVRSEEKDRFASALTKIEGERDELRARLKHATVVKTSLAKAAQIFHDDALEFVEAKIEKYCDTDEGEIVVKDDAGKIRDSKDPRRKMSVEEFLEELAEKHPSMAKAKGSSGGRAPGSKETGKAPEGSVTLDKYLRMSNAERVAQLTPKERVRLSQLALSNK